MLNIVLYEPEMPANTGNIGRTCVATGARLHLIEPLGFQINDKMLKRAGLDYWPKLDVTVYEDYEDFLKKNPHAKIYMATTKSKQKYTDVTKGYPYTDEKGLFHAQITSIEPTGHLVLTDKEGTQRRYAFKEVRFVIPTPTNQVTEL